MIVLIVSHAAGTPEIGPNMRTFYLGRKLIKRSHEVHIVGSGRFHKYHHSPLVNNRYTTKEIEGINYHWLPTYNYRKRNYQQVVNQFDFAWKVWQYRKRWMELSPDIIIFSSPPPIAVIPAALLKRKLDISLIFEERDIWPLGILDIGKLSKGHPYVKLLQTIEKHAYRKADAIVSVKKGDYKFYQENFPRHYGKYSFIPNGYDVEDQPEIFNSRTEGNGKFVFGYIGAFSNVYNLELILKAARELKKQNNIRFQLVGAGEDLKRLKTQAAEWGLSNVEFTGSVPKNKVMSYLKNFDVAMISLKSTPPTNLVFRPTRCLSTCMPANLSWLFTIQILMMWRMPVVGSPLENHQWRK
ncbi:MAG: glycosyltransferase family 4 protein [Owenweeksia sp.]|nr:glycosyltransferase family 4 protein [Owenweeksia sp.]